MKIHFFNFDEGSELQASPISSKGKFVQVIHEDLGEYLIFSPVGLYKFHAEILFTFCQQQSPPWAFKLNSKSDDGCSEDPRLAIVGGGFWEDFHEKKRLTLGGCSQAFGDFNNFGLEKKLQHSDRFKEYRISC